MSNLVLTRRPGEVLLIGDNITITVISVNGNQVKMAINAPREIKVLRKEVEK